MEKCCVVLISIHLICTENYTTVLSIAVAKLAHSNNYQSLSDTSFVCELHHNLLDILFEKKKLINFQ